MRCEKCREALCEGRSSIITAPDLRAHLESCPACRELSGKLAGIDAASLRFDVEPDAAYTAFRKRIILQKVASQEAVVPERSASRWGIWVTRSGFATLLVTIAVMALVVFRPHTPDGIVTRPIPNAAAVQQPAAGNPAHNSNAAAPLPATGQGESAQNVAFELQKVDSAAVRLTWKGDDDAQYRIYKGANPAHMKPVLSVKGLQWIDHSPDSSPIVFYKVEAY